MNLTKYFLHLFLIPCLCVPLECHSVYTSGLWELPWMGTCDRYVLMKLVCLGSIVWNKAASTADVQRWGRWPSREGWEGVWNTCLIPVILRLDSQTGYVRGGALQNCLSARFLFLCFGELSDKTGRKQKGPLNRQPLSALACWGLRVALR